MIVYSYGLKAPVVASDLVEQQLRRAHDYRNKLVELARAARAERESVLLTHAPYAAAAKVHGDAEAALVAARQELRDLRASNHEAAENVVPEALLARIKDLRTVEKSTRTAMRAARAEATALRVDELTRSAASAAALKRSARAACGVYWCTYLLVERAIDAAEKTPGGAHFERWTGEGQLGAQLQGGLVASDVVAGTDTQVQIVPGHVNYRSRKKDGRIVELPRPKDATRRRMLRIRVGSEDRAPVWAEFPLYYDRDLPEGGIVKWVQVVRRRNANRYDWRARITLESPADSRPVRQALPMVAVDLGWRRVPTGIRVAYAVGTDGVSSELVLPEEVVTGWQKVAGLRSTRDKNFNEVLEELLAFRRVDLAATDGYRTPEEQVHADWFRERTTHAHAWRSPARLAGLVGAWRERRFSGDGVIYQRVLSWAGYRGDGHLWSWESNMRDKILARRDDIYAKFAARLCLHYGSIVFESFDLRAEGIGRAPAAENGTQNLGSPYRVLGAPGRLRERIKTTATREGVGVLNVSAVNTTRRCHACGLVRAFNAAEELHHRCSGCGVEWDQDQNAAKNMLADALREHSGGAPRPTAARKVKSAWARRKAAKVERQSGPDTSAVGTAREAAHK